MDDRYRTALESARKLIVQAVFECEPELEKEPLRLDERVRALTRELGRDVLVDVYEELSRRVTERAQQRGLVVQRRPEIEVVTVFGAVSVPSPYLWNPERHEGARPVRSDLGLEHRHRSPALERALVDFGAEESFGHAAQRVQEHYGFSLGRTTILRVVEGHARRAEFFIQARLDEAKRRFEEPPAKRPGVDRMLTELDGCEIRTGTLERTPGEERSPVRRLPKRRRNEAWRDVRVGLARPLGEVDSTYVARMDTYPHVVGQLFGAACDRGLSSRTKVVAVGDGGQGLREELDAQFTGLQFVLDRPHLKGHLYETAESMGLKDVARESWVSTRMERIDRGHVGDVLQELSAHKGRGKARVRRLHSYLKRFRDAVHYDAFRAQEIPLGSGEIESAHRTIPQKRLKLPGTWWHPDTVNPMLALRVLRANRWWETYWARAA